MRETVLPIDPDTKVAKLLDHYPQLEDVLISIAPPFRKLRNPVLRKSVARVASLRQAAAVAGLSVEELVSTLRSEVGQEVYEADSEPADLSYFAPQPDWFDPEMVVRSIDEREVDPETMPLTAVIRGASSLQSGEILVLITSFLPAPGIDIISKKGFRVWATREGDELIRTYISNP
jgi:hypothetical protein